LNSRVEAELGWFFGQINAMLVICPGLSMYKIVVIMALIMMPISSTSGPASRRQVRQMKLGRLLNCRVDWIDEKNIYL
jgi:hypothetical protein